MRDGILKELIAAAEESEKKARELEEAAGKGFLACGWEYGSARCQTCRHFDFCEVNETVRGDAALDLFADALKKYGQALVMARKAVRDTESVENYALLARVLLNIALHPATSNFQDCPELWEVQYIWLHLFYRTREKRYLEQAKQCDGFRHACVVEIPDGEKERQS